MPRELVRSFDAFQPIARLDHRISLSFENASRQSAYWLGIFDEQDRLATRDGLRRHFRRRAIVELREGLDRQEYLERGARTRSRRHSNMTVRLCNNAEHRRQPETG